jgi:hypothetical protein
VPYRCGTFAAENSDGGWRFAFMLPSAGFQLRRNSEFLA